MMLREGKCCRALVACSSARVASPPTTIHAKFFTNRTDTASDRRRTTPVFDITYFVENAKHPVLKNRVTKILEASFPQ